MRIPNRCARFAGTGMLALCFLLGVSCGGSRRDFGTLPTITSDDPKAEAELQKVRDLEEQGDSAGAEAGYRRFIATRPRDALVPVAELALGRIVLQRGDHAEAKVLFDRLAKRPEQAIADQGRFYGGVAAHRLGDHAAAVSALQPMVGQPTDPDDVRLLLRTLAQALIELSRYAEAITALDALATEKVAETDQEWAKAQILVLVKDKAGREDIELLYRDLDHDGVAWPHVVRRALRDADAAGDADEARELLEVMREENLSIGTELGAIAMRAERPTDANPQVVGAILSLSGRGRRVGELSLRGIMLAAGLPPSGPQGANAAQVVFRDDGGDPERAKSAVNELVATHRAIAIIGPLDTRVADVAAARAQELGVPIVLLSAGGKPTERGAMVYRMFATPVSEMQALISRAKADNRKRVAALLPEGPYGDLMEATLREQATPQGLALAHVERYAPLTTSFVAQAKSLATHAFDTLLLADSAQQIALIAPALATAGLWCAPAGQAAPASGRAIAIMAPAVAFDHALAKTAGRYLQGAYFSVPFDAQTAEGAALSFVQNFEAQFGERPDMFAAFSHDAYKIVRSAVEQGNTTRETLAANLWRAEPTTLAGPSPGLLPDREARRGTRLLQLLGDRFVPMP